MNVSKEDPLQLVNRTIQMGERSPMLAAALGKAILAYLPEHEIEQYSSSVKPTAITPKTIADLKVVESKLDGVCSYGTACDRQDISDRMIAMAALIFDLYALVVASTVVSLPVIRFTPEKKNLITYVSQEVFMIPLRKLGFEVNFGVNELEAFSIVRCVSAMISLTRFKFSRQEDTVYQYSAEVRKLSLRPSKNIGEENRRPEHLQRFNQNVPPLGGS